MRGTQFRSRHLLGAASFSSALVLAALSLTGAPVAAQSAPATTATTAQSCPVLSVGNPNPGDNINTGAYVITGQAFDPAAQSGAGISRVDLFLGERDLGGTFLGSAVPGEDNTDPRAFSVEVTVPSNFSHETDFSAYAISSVTGAETAVTFPIFVGSQPRNPSGLVTPTPVPNFTATVTNNCSTQPATAPAANAQASATPGTASSTTTTSPATSTTTTARAGAATTSACPTLSLANPGPGDTLTAGGLIISGTAIDPGAGTGSGVQRVDLFLGPRDQGGTFLGSGVPGTGGSANSFSVEVQVPNLGRGVEFSAYAIGANGQEEVVSFPVFVGSPPQLTSGAATPTPVPATQTITSTCAR
jgi:hypothetical protein